MFSFITLLFFAVTGITLNHPEWLGSSGKEGVTVNGTLKPEAINGEKVDWLKVVEQVRAEHSVRGAAVEMRVDSGEGSFAFRSPGSIAECFFDLKTGKYELKTDTPSVLATVNDLHRGRDAGRAWFWFISAVFGKGPGVPAEGHSRAWGRVRAKQPDRLPQRSHLAV